jgi:hypothetical protein
MSTNTEGPPVTSSVVSQNFLPKALFQTSLGYVLHFVWQTKAHTHTIQANYKLTFFVGSEKTEDLSERQHAFLELWDILDFYD